MTTFEGKDFEAHRSFLAGLAYRMLGSIPEAEDIVQDVVARTDGRAPGRADGRRSLDRVARHARAVVAPRARRISVARGVRHELRRHRERARPQRGRVSSAHRPGSPARADERPRFAPTDANREKLFAAFESAMTSGDLSGFAQLLADDAVLYADGAVPRSTACPASSCTPTTASRRPRSRPKVTTSWPSTSSGIQTSCSTWLPERTSDQARHSRTGYLVEGCCARAAEEGHLPGTA
jgi:DNA-directed RNA polymerase specialized sigma24 family protein